MSSPLITALFLLSFILLQFQSTKALFSPIKKDESTKLYTMQIYLKTPLQPSQLHIDLGSYLPFFDCAGHYNSSSWKPILYNTSLCLSMDTGIYTTCDGRPPSPSCSQDRCSFFSENPVTNKQAIAQLLTDKFALRDAVNQAKLGPVSDIVLSCITFPDDDNYPRIFRGLAKGSAGLAPLGRYNYSLSAQISRVSSSPRIFALCLPSSSNSTGGLLFNSAGPYKFTQPEIDVSKLLVYTPLVLGPPVENPPIYKYTTNYYIGLTSFRVNGRIVRLNQTLLAINEEGRGGTKLSTSRPYTSLQRSIFQALKDAFVRESAALNLTLIVQPPSPFRVCYAAENIPVTAAGPAVPAIDLVMGKSRAFWRINGSNSMVRIKNGRIDAWCLGFVDAGKSPETSVVIGGHQMEDNLVEFDLERERLGFSSSLLLKNTNCANFNFPK